jgi:hypothetical protein
MEVRKLARCVWWMRYPLTSLRSKLQLALLGSIVVLKCDVRWKNRLLDAVCCVLCVVIVPNALQTFPYYHFAPCLSAFRHFPEMLYYIVLNRPQSTSVRVERP